MSRLNRALTAGLGSLPSKKGSNMFMRRGERGFTLLEVLIAVCIFAVGVLAVATMQISGTRGNRLANELTQATALAQDRIEELKSKDISSADLAPGNYDDPGNPIAETTSGAGLFNRSWVITGLPTTPPSRSVTVTVAWTLGGNTHNVVLTTITRGGGN